MGRGGDHKSGRQRDRHTQKKGGMCWYIQRAAPVHQLPVMWLLPNAQACEFFVEHNPIQLSVIAPQPRDGLLGHLPVGVVGQHEPVAVRHLVVGHVLAVGNTHLLAGADGPARVQLEGVGGGAQAEGGRRVLGVVGEVRERHGQSELAVGVAARPRVRLEGAAQHAGERPREALRRGSVEEGCHRGARGGGRFVAESGWHREVSRRQQRGGVTPRAVVVDRPEEERGEARVRWQRLLLHRLCQLSRRPAAAQQVAHQRRAAAGGDDEAIRERDGEEHVALASRRRREQPPPARALAHRQRRGGAAVGHESVEQRGVAVARERGRRRGRGRGSGGGGSRARRVPAGPGRGRAPW